MVRIFLVMHKPLGTALAHCAEHVLGSPQSALHVVDVVPDADVETLSARLSVLLLKAPDSGSLVLCDLYGATPFNVAQRAIALARQQGAKTCLLTGANLNMILKALTDPSADLDVLRDSVRCSAVRGIVDSGTSGSCVAS